jgi:hypothetical protein
MITLQVTIPPSPMPYLIGELNRSMLAGAPTTRERIVRWL